MSSSRPEPQEPAPSSATPEGYLSLRQVAEALALEPVRLYRLGHHLGLAPRDPCVPRAVVIEAQAKADKELRYRVILGWLLAHLRESRELSEDGSQPQL